MNDVSLLSDVRGALRYSEPMSRHSSWRCGGDADRYFTPLDRDDLIDFLRAIPDNEPLHWLGLGSNMLIRDGGVCGTVIATSPGLSRFHWIDAERLYAQGGATCSRLAREAAAMDRGGIEFLAGIPGTLGGALTMNAGAHGRETWDFIEWVETVDRHGQTRRRECHEYNVGYRQVDGPDGEWFIAGVMRLPEPANGTGAAHIKRVLAQRAATQPSGKATCGSVFRNPPGDFAGRLIEHCGLKGYRLGGCLISTVHANFIVNEGEATADEVERLIAYVQRTVEAASGIHLEPEVRIIGRKDGRGQSDSGNA